jgi:hypothetical protein
MSPLKAIALVLSISVLYFGLGVVGAAFTGAGHGSEFFIMAVFAPFSVFEEIARVGIILWPTVAVLLALCHVPACRIAAAATLVLHYVGIAIVSFRTDWHYVRTVWHSMPVMVVAFAGVYLASQSFMWWLISRRQKAD